MVKTYKWSLRKGGKKLRCPQCGQKRFVPFVLTTDGKTMAGAEFGRCDREQSCGYFRYPDKEAKATVEVEPRPELPPALFSFFFRPDVSDDNSLYKAYSPLIGAFKLKMAMKLYKCDTGINGECIYPQYDGEWLRTSKAIKYDKSGHRLKSEDGESLPVHWLHKSSQYAEYMQTHQLKQCFFGQHLLAQYPKHEVWIVEAEKTAVLMAATDDRSDRIWIACGGSQMLKGAIDLDCLKGRDVVLVPDDGQYWNWKRTADAHFWKCLDIAHAMEARNLPEGSDVWDNREYELKQSKNR